MGGYLAKVDDYSENLEIYTSVSSAMTTSDWNYYAMDGGGSTYVWLGASDSQVEGVWKWTYDNSTLSTTRTEWGKGLMGSEPDNYSNQDYLALGLENWPYLQPTGQGHGDAGQWNDINGTNLLYFVVEKNPTDSVAPVLEAVTPAYGAQGVSVTANFVLTFNEVVTAGSGYFVVKSGGVTLATISVADTSQVFFSGATVTINPTANLAANTSYSVEVASGVVKDAAGNNWAGNSSSPYVFSTGSSTDTIAPTISSFSPADEAVSVAVGANIVVTFNEVVQRGIGSIVLKTSAGVVVATYDAASSSNLSISGNTLTINPTADLALGTGYKVEFAAGTVKDLAGNSYVGTTSYNFTTGGGSADTTPPTEINRTTYTNAFKVNFSEPIKVVGNGISIYEYDNVNYKTIGSNLLKEVAVNGSTLVAITTQTLSSSKNYQLYIPSGALFDLAGNDFCFDVDKNITYLSYGLHGTPSSTALDLTGIGTGASTTDTVAPTVTAFSPADEASGVAVGANIVVTFNEAVQRGSGSIALKTSSGVTVATYDAATSSNLSISGSTLTINPTADLALGTGYKVEFAAGTVKDLAGNSYVGTTTYNFTTGNSADTTPPSYTQYTAYTNAFKLSFSEAIKLVGSGISIYEYDNVNYQSIGPNLLKEVVVNGSTLIAIPTQTLSSSKSYQLTIPSGAIFDLSGNDFCFDVEKNVTYYSRGFSSSPYSGALDLTGIGTGTTTPDTFAPYLTSAFPGDGSVGVAVGANFVGTFSEPVKAGTGNILIKSGTTTVATIAVTDTSQVTFNGSTVTVNPTTDLAYNTRYTVEYSTGVIKDMAGNSWAFDTSYPYNFTTEAYSGAGGPSPSWIRLLGGAGSEYGNALTTGIDGSIYVAGSSPTALGGQPNSGGSDAVISKYDSSGTKLWTRLVGGADEDFGAALETGLDGSIYIGGVTANSLDGQTNSGAMDAFVSKYSPTGIKLWTRLVGGTGYDGAGALTLGLDGSIYVAGDADNVVDGQQFNGVVDAFISKYDASGNKAWTRLVGGTAFERGTALATGSDGSIYLAGYTQGTFDSQTNKGGTDAYVSKFDANGNQLWTRLIGGAGSDYGKALAIGLDGSIYLAGDTDGSMGGQSNSGSYDAFVTKLDSSGNTLWTRFVGGTGNDGGAAITLGVDGAIYLGGSTNGSIDGQTNSGSWDPFVAKFDSSGTKAWTAMGGSVSGDGCYALTTGLDGAIYAAGETDGDLGGQVNAGSSDIFLAKFVSSSTADTTAPVLSGISPVDGATGVAVSANCVMAFSEAVKAGSGNFVIKSGSTTVATIAVTDSSQVTFSGLTVTINPVSNLAYNTSYTVELATGVIKDMAGNNWVVDPSNPYNFTTGAVSDTIAPTVTAYSPADEAGAVAISANILVTFSEAVQRGTGSIVLKTAAGAVIATYDAATSSNLSISGNILTLNPSADLAYSTGYKVEFASGAIKDIAGNSYIGVSDYNFTTGAAPDTTAPTVTTFSPADDAKAVAIGANIVLTFSEAVQRGSGNIIIKTAAGAVIATYDAATSSNLSISGNTLTLNPTLDLDYNTGYKVEFASGAVKDMAGNSYVGTTTYNFSTSGSVFNGTSGNDNLIGINMPDSIYGFAGNDTLNGGAGNDTLNGGAGSDTFVVGSGTDTISDLGNGADILNVSAGATANATITGAWNASAATTNSGVANISTNGMAVNLAAVTSGSAGFGITNTGTATALTGSALADTLIGGTGQDTLTGGAGNDSLDGGTGADTLLGGSGNDTYVVNDKSDAVFETITAGGTKDAGGSDTVLSSVSYTLGNYVENLTLTGLKAIDGTGNTLANTLMGNSGANTLNGGTGSDILYGGLGADVLYGGADKVMDSFNFAAIAESTQASRDKVYDFTSGIDKIDLSGIDANSKVAGDQAFVNTGTIGTTAKSYSIWSEKVGSNLVIYADTDGKAATIEFQIQIMGVTKVALSDFVL
ncbi:MAG: Ig-like domain-containing protein [Rhodoferax sp.]|nr:Ig-like domain-containing protein [Rhodoferax sp.]